MNSVCLMGRMVRDAELRYTSGSNAAMARFTVAVDRGVSKAKREEMEAQGKQTADFIRCVAFGKTAEMVSTYFPKGSQIAIIGRIQTGSYQTEDGSMRYTTDVVVERVSFIDSNKNRNIGSNENNDMYPIDEGEIPF